MSIEERMTINERRKYLHKMRIRYWQANSKQEKTKLLNEMEAVTELHRKSLLRLINGDLARIPRRKQRGRTYGADVEKAVRVIAHSLDYPCAERLRPNLVWIAKQLAQHKEMTITPELLKQLDQISVSTLARMLKRTRQGIERIAYRRKPRAPTRHILKNIPMKRISWEMPTPGHFEVDLVHHNGESSCGQYVHTIQMLDVTTGWSECVAVLGRSYRVMLDGFEHMLARLPIQVLEIHPDNGSEFFNHHLLRFWKTKVQDMELSRSRPYQKNDNRFVEENNFSLVRAYVGYHRLDTIDQTKLLNQLYELLWWYHNFFQPVMRLRQKTVSHSSEQSRRVKRIYDEARTPFDRLCSSATISLKQQKQLETMRKKINPCQLRSTIEKLIDQLFALPSCRVGIVEDIHQTIGLWKSGQQAAHFPTISTITAINLS